jgi:C-terminal processing protease CtpA/Prc
MGNSSSNADLETVGFRILGVQPNSPAEKVGLVSFFDFIVAVDGTPLRNLEVSFIEIIKQSEDQPLPLKVYNCKNHSLREIVLVPSTKWPGEGMLGVTIRFDSYHDAEEHLCHVLEVQPNSPAELAGLVPEADYLLGTAEKAFKDFDTLGEELKNNVDKPVEFFVYNAESGE